MEEKEEKGGKKSEMEENDEEGVSLCKYETRGFKTRTDTRLPKSRAGGQGPYLRSLDYLGRSSGVRK